MKKKIKNVNFFAVYNNIINIKSRFKNNINIINYIFNHDNNFLFNRNK